MGSTRSFYRFLPSAALSAITLTAALQCASVQAAMSSQEAFFLKRITEYTKEGDSAFVKNQIENFLAKYPQSTVKNTLLPVLISLYIKEKNFEKSLQMIEEIASEKENIPLSYHKTICLYELGKDDDLINHASKVLALPHAVEQVDTIRYFLANTLLKKAKECEGSCKKDLLEQSLIHFTSLEASIFSESALRHAAAIASALSVEEKACYFYKKIADKNPCDKEEMLFQAACHQAKIKPLDAVKTLGQVYKMRGKRASDAAIMQLKILLSLQKHKELLLYLEEAKRHVDAKDRRSMHTFAAKSLMHLEDFEAAKGHLQSALDLESLDDVQSIPIMKDLLFCSRQLKDSAYMENILARWQKISPDDNSLADAYILCYGLAQNTDSERSCTLAEHILEKYPTHPYGETILYNLALLESKRENWQRAAIHFTCYLDKYPEGRFASLALHGSVKAKMEQLRSSPLETRAIFRSDLIDTLAYALQKEKVFSEEEKNTLTFSYAKHLAQSMQYEKSLDVLLEYVDNGPSQKMLCEAYLLIAHCYRELKANTPLFISYAEKAIAANQGQKAVPSVHTALYNAYLELAHQSPYEDTSELVDRGAAHLLAAFTQGAELKEENLLWLSDILYRAAQSHANSSPCQNDKTISDAVSVAMHIVDIKHYPPKIDLSKIPHSFESEMLHLADLLGWQGKWIEKIDTLEVLVHAQKTLNDKHWKMQQKAQLELARAYQQHGSLQLANDTYEEIIRQGQYSLSSSTMQARFEKAKIDLYQLKEEKALPEDGRWHAALDALKDLEIQRKVALEPLHLEAALCYAEHKSHLFPDDERKQKSLTLLEKIKEGFTASTDKQTESYLAALQKQPEKKRIYDLYMKFVDYLIFNKKAEIANHAHSESDAREYNKKSMALLQEISRSNQLPIPLKERIAQSMEEAKTHL